MEVSDRLVTTDGRAFDAEANKTILFLGLDCSVTISYTGLAYIEGMNTDQWIVERIADQSLNTNGRPAAMGGYAATRQSQNLGLTVAYLAKSLEAYFASPNQRRDKVSLAFELQICGWYWGRRRRPRPVCVEIVKPAGVKEFSVRWSRRHYSQNEFTLSSIGARLTSTENDQLRAGIVPANTLNETEQTLIDAVRSVSNRLSTVGADCMSILIARPEQRFAIVRYHPSKPLLVQRTANQPGSSGRSVPAVYSPWILSSTFIHAPSIVVGGWSLNLGGRRVTLEAPTPPAGGLVAAIIPAIRPREPR